MSAAAEAIVMAVLGLVCFVAAVVIDQRWCWTLLALGSLSLGYSVAVVRTDMRASSR